jgi:hypothetical protein
MKPQLTVARYQLADRITYLIQPWGVLAFAFGVNVVLAALDTHEVVRTWGLASIFGYVLVAGTVSTARWLPFGLMLGASRRQFFQGTALLAVALSAVYSLILTLLQVAERASGGWGLRLHFFRVDRVLAGPWYQTWLTSFVLLALFWVYGMWFGLVFRRWNLPGLIVFMAAQVVVVLGAVVPVSLTHAWPSVGNFLGGLTAPALAGIAAAGAVALALGGLGTIRRLTV